MIWVAGNLARPIDDIRLARRLRCLQSSFSGRVALVLHPIEVRFGLGLFPGDLLEALSTGKLIVVAVESGPLGFTFGADIASGGVGVGRVNSFVQQVSHCGSSLLV
jgi:hypothetical protein